MKWDGLVTSKKTNQLETEIVEWVPQLAHDLLPPLLQEESCSPQHKQLSPSHLKKNLSVKKEPSKFSHWPLKFFLG